MGQKGNFCTCSFCFLTSLSFNKYKISKFASISDLMLFALDCPTLVLSRAAAAAVYFKSYYFIY